MVGREVASQVGIKLTDPGGVRSKGAPGRSPVEPGHLVQLSFYDSRQLPVKAVSPPGAVLAVLLETA